MSDFHASLDRALEHEDGAYERFVEAVPRAIIAQDDTTVTFRVSPGTPQERHYRFTEPLEAPEAAQPLGEGWQSTGWVDEGWETTDLRAIQQKINRDISDLAARSLGFAFFSPPEPLENDPLADLQHARDLMESAERWPPATDRFWAQRWVQPLEFTASIETIELLCGAGLIPLCERQIPAEGTE